MSAEVSNPAVVEMRGVTVTALSDNTLVVLENVNWSVLPGEFWVVAGPPRSGKSDLLMHAAGLMVPVAGTCRVFGVDTKEFDESRLAERKRIGFGFADGKLFNQLTIAENIALPLRYHSSVPEEETAKTVATLMDLLELKPVADLTTGNVAMAWRQRAGLARALALKPELLLLDNPNGGLMARHRLWLVNFLDQLWRGHEFFGGRPMTIVSTTDDLRAWQNPQRKFAALYEGHFSGLGAWGGDEFGRHDAVKELLAMPGEMEKL